MERDVVRQQERKKERRRQSMKRMSETWLGEKKESMSFQDTMDGDGSETILLTK